MDAVPSTSLVNRMAGNYLACLADFPPDLKPEHLQLPMEEQPACFAGLRLLHQTIGQAYDEWARLESADARLQDSEYCHRAIEAPVRMLWAFGSIGQLAQTPDGLELSVRREDFDGALKAVGALINNAALSPTIAVLEVLGFQILFRGVDGQPAPGYRVCESLALRCPGGRDDLLSGLVYFATRLPRNKATKKGLIYEIFLRADFRPLLPSYTFHIPHLPADEKEVIRTFDTPTLAVWKALTAYMTAHYPRLRLYFRVPRLAQRGWVADYSTKDNDYGLWSIFVEEGGLFVRIVLNRQMLLSLLDHIDSFTPRFQQMYLNAVRCKDCVHCGHHVFFTHSGHQHKLCKSPWLFSSYLRLEDLPDIERLVEYRLEGVN